MIEVINNTITGKITEREIEDATIEVIVMPKPIYSELVAQLIAEKYNLNQEIALNRQRDTKVVEFQEYFDFCEECKLKARELCKHY